MKRVLLALVALAGCNNGDDLPGLLDTGWFDDTDVISACPNRVTDVRPAEDGTEGWYWLDSPQLFLSQPDPELSVWLTDDVGKPVPFELQASDTGLIVDVVPSRGLGPDTTYVLGYTDCEGGHEVSFKTSTYGTPIVGGPSTLVGRTYLLDLPEANWVEPGGFGTILATNFDTPILMTVRHADASRIGWLGGQGWYYVGDIEQDRTEPTWDFPVSPFDTSPFFDTRADQVELLISDNRLPITDFRLAGTFASDGSHFAGGELEGLGDTRYAGGALGQPLNPSAFCQLAQAVGVACEACPDGEVYCLQVKLIDMVGTEVEGLTLVPISL